jgi:hypothetical protein
MVRTSRAHVRAYHPAGMADPEGFAAMGCHEALLHGNDIAQGFGLSLEPSRDVCRRVLARIFPQASAELSEADPWAALLWAGGRIDLPGHPKHPSWRPHPAPLTKLLITPPAERPHGWYEPGIQARVLTLMAFQALMVTMRLTSPATWTGLNSAATSRYAWSGTCVVRPQHGRRGLQPGYYRFLTRAGPVSPAVGRPVSRVCGPVRAAAEMASGRAQAQDRSGSLSGWPLVSSPGSWVQAGEGGNHCGGRRADSDAPAAGIRHRGGRSGHDPRRRGDHRGRGYLRVRGRAGVRAQDLLAASAHAQEPPRPPHAA